MIESHSLKVNLSDVSVGELAAAMQALPVGVLIIDSGLSIRFWNQAFCRLLNLPGEIMRPGLTLIDLFYFEARRGDYGPGNPNDQVRERIELVQRFEPYRLTCVRMDGTILDITGRVIYENEGPSTGFVTTYLDVTRETRIAEQAKKSNMELQTAYEKLKLAQISNEALEVDRRKYYKLAVSDPVTGLFTRYYMEDAASRLLEQHERDETARVCLLLFDVDHFKDINDTYGHLCGDIVLRQVGSILAEQSRRIDVAVRFGGDEFAVFFPGIDEFECRAFAERLRVAIAAIRFEETLSSLALTISAGVAEHRRGESMTDLIHRADAALYEAKRAGRNRVEKAQ